MSSSASSASSATPPLSSGHTLWLLRHAKTVADPPKGGVDFDRRLTPRGRRDAVALAELLGRDGAGLGLPEPGVPLPEVALVSPAARTQATAELVLAELDSPPRRQLVPSFYNADPEEILDELRALDDGVRSVMVVGHNPTAHALSQGLITKKDTAGRDLATRRGFPTCALGIYVFDVANWRDVGRHTARLAGLYIPPFDKS
jgi:phosphohistidine phosphatase